MKSKIKLYFIEVTMICLSLTMVVPIAFAFVNSMKNSKEASWMNIKLPEEIHLVSNYLEVLEKGKILSSFTNSVIITAASVAMLIVISSMAAFVMSRRESKYSKILDFLILAGLIVPPSIVPTMWMMRLLHINNTKFSLIIMEAVLQFSFATILYRGFYTSIPRELDEAAIVDGCDRWSLYFKIIFPLLKPVTITVLILTSITIFNDFANPLYFLSGANNTTIQLTVYYFFGKYSSEWNLVFTDVILISLPPLIFYIFLNKRIIGGMTAGSLKG